MQTGLIYLSKPGLFRIFKAQFLAKFNTILSVIVLENIFVATMLLSCLVLNTGESSNKFLFGAANDTNIGFRE